ncbi:hypothetical protein HYFRA_00006758 [Hymenoscyphus fraxineus]|uniref:Uncharacterized protein n=1 Tax=Hymenoscyphus fraxineus TaxID=746836 RepID=A0A9N9KNM1_9HELO|nr:hypothetical protein HYFRA_00006758 [Hymenoscyphus fraxineus]
MARSDLHGFGSLQQLWGRGTIIDVPLPRSIRDWISVGTSCSTPSLDFGHHIDRHSPYFRFPFSIHLIRSDLNSPRKLFNTVVAAPHE